MSVKKAGSFMMIIMDKTIVTVGRKYRSKWYGVTCSGCSVHKRRKDGSCKHERHILESLRPEIRRRTKIEPAKEDV